MAQGTLASSLERLYHDYNREDSAADPVQLVRPYSRPEDREIAGFCAAALAFGRVASVLASISTLFRIMGDAAGAVRAIVRPGRAAPRAAGDGAPLDAGRRSRGAAVDSAADARAVRIGGGVLRRGPGVIGVDVSGALDSFSRRALAIDVRPVYGRVPKRAGVCYFFPRPSAGSACKRLNLFLRWMVRSDEVDLGVWRSVRPGQLIVPLDTHIIRLARCLRLTRYTSPGWKMAADITARLRALDPHDPVRFDFSICHVGMMNACGFGRGQGDSRCPLKGHCHPRVRQRATASRAARTSGLNSARSA